MQAVGYYVFDTPGRIVERGRFEVRVPRKQIAALIERDGMGEDPPQIAKFRARQSDQVVNNAQAKLADKVDLATQQKIEMLGH